MNKLTITRQNGNVPRTLEGQDHISGLIFYVPASGIPTGFQSEHIHAVSTITAVEALGISGEDTASVASRLIHYQLEEAFRVNDGISLYVGIFAHTSSNEFTEIKTMQNYAGGTIRQIGIWDGLTDLAQGNVAKIQTNADQLDEENAPLSVVYAPRVANINNLADLSGSAPRVSVLIGQSGSGVGAELAALTAMGTGEDMEELGDFSVTSIGVVTGLISAAQVHQSISWVGKFPTGVSTPAFSDGTLLRNTDRATLERLDGYRYLFFVTHVGVADSYMNDSHNLDAATSDYATIEAVRTMDKAVRGVRTYVVPELGGNVYVDQESGKMQPYSVSHLETVANKALEDMEKAGELSGYKVEIDPEQDVLSTSTVEMVIKQVAVGVMRKINIKIGFTKTVD